MAHPQPEGGSRVGHWFSNPCPCLFLPHFFLIHSSLSTHCVWFCGTATPLFTGGQASLSSKLPRPSDHVQELMLLLAGDTPRTGLRGLVIHADFPHPLADLHILLSKSLGYPHCSDKALETQRGWMALFKLPGAKSDPTCMFSAGLSLLCPALSVSPVRERALCLSQTQRGLLGAGGSWFGPSLPKACLGDRSDPDLRRGPCTVTGSQQVRCLKTGVLTGIALNIMAIQSIFF